MRLNCSMLDGRTRTSRETNRSVRRGDRRVASHAHRWSSTSIAPLVVLLAAGFLDLTSLEPCGGGAFGEGVIGGSRTAAAAEPFAGRKSDYNGYERYDFKVDDRDAIVVVPKQAAAGRPWVWRAEFFNAFPQVDLALLERGYHLAYIQVGNTFGCPDALKHWDVFYRELTEKHGLSRRPILEGLSRGGLYCFNWAANHTDQVGGILADNAVLDFKSWPGGKGTGKGSPNDWKKLIQDYHFASEAEALAYKSNPVDNLAPLAKAKVPLYLLYADKDDVVPHTENSELVKKRYEQMGGPVVAHVKPGLGHHPHGLTDAKPVVDWAERIAREPRLP